MLRPCLRFRCLALSLLLLLAGVGLMRCGTGSERPAERPGGIVETIASDTARPLRRPLVLPDTNRAHPPAVRTTQQEQIPAKVFDVLDYIRKNDRAPQGYVGGRRFGNYEKRLPQRTPGNRPIRYWEWDVNPRQQGRNRGAERLVTGSDGRAWFTRDHYNSFVEVKKARRVAPLDGTMVPKPAQ